MVQLLYSYGNEQWECQKREGVRALSGWGWLAYQIVIVNLLTIQLLLKCNLALYISDLYSFLAARFLSLMGSEEVQYLSLNNTSHPT